MPLALAAATIQEEDEYDDMQEEGNWDQEDEDGGEGAGWGDGEEW